MIRGESDIELTPEADGGGMAAAAVWVEPSQLRAWAKNPRKNDGEPVAKVAESIKRFGFGAPIVARRATREIIAGHTRWKAAKKLGLERVPVRYMDISEDDARKLALADNKLGELAEWDHEALHAELAQYDRLDVELLGWTGKEFDRLTRAVLIERERADELAQDAVPEPPANPVTEPGDVWQLGRHRLLCGDARDPSSYARLLGSGPSDVHKVNIALTSPPYANKRKYDVSSGFEPIEPERYVEWFAPVQACVRSVLADDGSWFLNVKAGHQAGAQLLWELDLVAAHVRQWSWRLVDTLCWTHGGFPREVREHFKNGWEPIYHFAGPKRPIKCRPLQVALKSDRALEYDAVASPTMSGAGGKAPAYEADRAKGLAYPPNVLRFQSGNGTTIAGHSATFPLQLPEFFIRAYTDEHDRVLDPFAGAGTTLIAAHQLEREAYAIELSPAYCDVIVERWQQLSGEKARKL